MTKYWRIGSRAVATLALVLLVVAAYRNINWVFVNRSFTTNFVLHELGVTGYVFHDAWQEVHDWWFDEHLQTVDATPYRKFLAGRAKKRQAALATMPVVKKRYVIYIQMEAIAASALKLKLDGHYVAPFLRQLRNHSLWFENAFDETDAGRTSDAEFLALTSVIPIQGTPVYTNQSLYQVPAVPRIFDAAGYTTISVHGFDGQFWHRRKSHKALGYEKQYYENDLKQDDKIGWGISDRSVMTQAVNILAAQKGKVFMHIITLSSHHPFDGVRKRFGGPDKGIVNDYLRSVQYLDGAVKLFFHLLKEKGILKHCVIALYGDHDSGITRQIIKYRNPPNRNPAAHDKITMMIYGLGRSGVVKRPSGLQDLAPTILTAQGLPVPATAVGGLPDSHISVLLPGGGAIVGMDSRGDPIKRRIPVDVRKLTLLSLHRPKDLAATAGAEP
ncbi:MAG TPA: LTA synthase family protein [Gammaproteobacteria bacterium]|nr:LTA synthase family protein [Gammaproteobacteria bacterium]